MVHQDNPTLPCPQELTGVQYLHPGASHPELLVGHLTLNSCIPAGCSVPQQRPSVHHCSCELEQNHTHNTLKLLPGARVSIACPAKTHIPGRKPFTLLESHLVKVAEAAIHQTHISEGKQEAHTCNPSTWEVEAGSPGIQDHPSHLLSSKPPWAMSEDSIKSNESEFEMERN